MFSQSGQFRITWENKINLDFLINQFPYCKNEKFFNAYLSGIAVTGLCNKESFLFRPKY